MFDPFVSAGQYPCQDMAWYTVATRHAAQIWSLGGHGGCFHVHVLCGSVAFALSTNRGDDDKMEEYSLETIHHTSSSVLIEAGCGMSVRSFHLCMFAVSDTSP